MKIKKVIAGVVLTGLSTGTGFANESTHGIGVAIDNSVKIFFPITNNNLIIEPSLAIRSSSDKASSEVSDYNWEYDSLEIGIGIFKTQKAYENTTLYYGARLGYREDEQKYKRSSVLDPVDSTNVEKQDGYFIAPTLGVEYFLSSNFSLGLDLSVKYLKMDGEDKGTYGVESIIYETESKSYDSQAEIIVRYHF